MLGVLQIGVLAQESGDGNITLGSILLYILVGAVVGVIARFLVPGDDPLGIIGTIVLGIVGAVIGGWLAGAVFEDTEGVDWIASIVVAVLLVLAVRMFRRSGTTNTRSRL
ncbi:MAG TPA: GlsB/YeaQ/YmgE family stress response membrane protein [Actinomycetota bacterium]|nr:GlsB/YeaQ/YmgE family stress response membrane protein [Actinomycetota bacterium]